MYRFHLQRTEMHIFKEQNSKEIHGGHCPSPLLSNSYPRV